MHPRAVQVPRHFWIRHAGCEIDEPARLHALQAYLAYPLMDTRARCYHLAWARRITSSRAGPAQGKPQSATNFVAAATTRLTETGNSRIRAIRKPENRWRASPEQRYTITNPQSHGLRSLDRSVVGRHRSVVLLDGDVTWDCIVPWSRSASRREFLGVALSQRFNRARGPAPSCPLRGPPALVRLPNGPCPVSRGHGGVYHLAPCAGCRAVTARNPLLVALA